MNNITVEVIKNLGKEKTSDNLDKLISFFNLNLPFIVKREIISSIGRHADHYKIKSFIESNVFNNIPMDFVYQMYRTTLYRSNISEFDDLKSQIEDFYDNEVIERMRYFYENKGKNIQNDSIKIIKPTLLIGDSKNTLKNINKNSVDLIFTSPPYYNARAYSVYKSYNEYLMTMQTVLNECNRVLEYGRFIVVNVSPVITKRAGREFESIRYPIHFDFHNILVKSGFYFIDEIIWIKPEYSVPNRVGGYLQTQNPLAYKPNCITESIMIYRKNAPFLLDKNIKQYPTFLKKNNEEIDTTNCWYINPKCDKNHPAVFPEKLCEKVIKYYSFSGDVVLDPFAGSGTLGRVAKYMNRIPLLCEKNEKYANLIERDGYDVFR